MQEKLNDDFMIEFEKSDKLYQDFYKDDVYFVGVKLIYVNRSNEIEKVVTDTFLLSNPNYIIKDEILQMLKKNSTENNHSYSLLSALKYNIALEPTDISGFLKRDDDDVDDYLVSVKNIDAIKFEKTINMFHDLNELILIFYEKSTNIKKKSVNSTKRHRLHTKAKKTIRKQYKD
tara:strand:+ start:26 stop:550 length:525 start_codon:yes stop_codon:yes gene_type:complete